MSDERRLSAEDLQMIRARWSAAASGKNVVSLEGLQVTLDLDGTRIFNHIDALESEFASLRDPRTDWPRGSTEEAVDRVRAAATGPQRKQVDPADLRKLFSSADGLADNYSQVVSEITGGMLSKPTTDPELALARMRELEDERFEEDLNEATEELRTALEASELINGQFREVLASEGYNVESIEAGILYTKGKKWRALDE